MTGISKRDGKASQFNAFLNKYQDSSFSLALLKKMETFRVSTNLSPIVLSVSGAPGTGKTTLANELAKAFKQFFGINSAIVSLDDFIYPERRERRIRESIHPLAITRGPPGTHDVERLIDVIKKLRTNFPLELQYLTRRLTKE